MAFESIPFAHSRMLGGRADAVYARFLRCLNVPGDVAECGVYEGETSHESVEAIWFFWREVRSSSGALPD